MTNDNDQGGDFRHRQQRSEFPHLVARHHQLVRSLKETEDPTLRAGFSQELRRVRQQIAEITDPAQPSDYKPIDSEGEQIEPAPDAEHQPGNHDLSDDDFSDDELTDERSVERSDEAENLRTDEPYVEDPPDQFAWHEPPQATDDVDYQADYQTEYADEYETYAQYEQLEQQQHQGEQEHYQREHEHYQEEEQYPEPQQPISPDADYHQSIELRPRATGEHNVSTSSFGLSRSIQPSGTAIAVVGLCFVAIVGLLWFGGRDRTGETAAELVDPASPTLAAGTDSDADAVVANIRAVMAGLGLSNIVVDHRDGTIHLGGPIPNQADFDAAVIAAQAVAGSFPLETSALMTTSTSEAGQAPPAAGESGEAIRADALQSELDRILAGTPLIFASGQAEVSDLHQRILNNVILTLSAYPGFSLTVAGFTDELGDADSNRALSLARAESVRQYLIGQGLPVEAFNVKAIGEGAASVAALAGLERRVELEVDGAAGPTTEQTGAVRVAIVAPSASNDLAFTQSMVDAVNLLATETPIELSVTDNTFVPDEAAAAVRGYAEQGYDLVIAHGSQFGASLLQIAPQHPETAFAWGTASDTFGLPNVYAYDAAAQQGGYLLGSIAAMLSSSDVIGVVGPIEVGDAALFVNGFTAGAKAQEPATDVRVTYTGSFSDTGLAAEAAQGHLGAGADVLTGSAQMVVGAVAAAQQSGALWFGTQADQASLAPESVVASQVYHWEVALRPIIQDIKAGRLAGNLYTADLANGGLVIEYNPGFTLAPEVRQRADRLFAEIANGTIVPAG